MKGRPPTVLKGNPGHPPRARGPLLRSGSWRARGAWGTAVTLGSWKTSIKKEKRKEKKKRKKEKEKKEKRKKEKKRIYHSPPGRKPGRKPGFAFGSGSLSVRVPPYPLTSLPFNLPTL